MTESNKFSLKKNCYSLIAFSFCIAITWKGEARDIAAAEIYSTLTSDTIPQPRKDSFNPLQKPDTIIRGGDTIIRTADTIPIVDTFDLKLSRDTLDAPVQYKAADSGVLLVREKKFLLYGNTKTTYNDIVLTAPKVELDQATNILTAYNSKDSLGNVIARAEFRQSEEGFQSDTIRYNFKTKRGLTTNTYTKHNEMYVQAPLIKKINDSTTFARHMTMTTCEYDHPHFGFVANKGKFITNRVAVTGPIHPEFEGVPVPLYLPFGIFPLKTGRHSGLLPPQFTATEQFGLGLEGLGYYHVLNDFVDVKVLGNIYSFGGWSASLIPTYRIRYRYSGGFNISLQRTKIAFKGDPDYSLTKTFNVSWNHVLDPKATRGSTFSANVNAGSTKFNQFIVNNPNRNFNNQLSSSIAYSKTWQGKPYNFTATANHNQNNNLHLINLILPDVGFTVTSIYPFQRKELRGSSSAKWYEKIGIGYSGVARNQISFYDTVPNTFKHILDTMLWGAQHRFPINMSLPPIGPLIVSPFISYEETWLTDRMRRRWNPITQQLDTLSEKKGLFIDRQMSFGIGVNTQVFGTFSFNKGKTLIRHVVRPTFSMNYRPNLSKKYYDVIQVDRSGYVQPLPQIVPGKNLFSSYGYGRFGGMTFGVDNNLEMKVPDKKDTTGENKTKKIRLIDGFGFSSGYNFLQDSMKLLPFNLYLRTTLFEKISLTAQALYSPYKQDSLGRDTRLYVWQGDRFRLGRLRQGSISMSTNFQSKPRDPKKSSQPVNQITDPSLMNDAVGMQDYIRRNPSEFVDFNIPWSINLSYSLVFSQEVRAPNDITTRITSNLNFSNTFSLTPKWMFSTNGYYDFSAMQLTMFTMSVSRDMHCWQMSLNVTPIGQFRSFNITISPKSSILQDLRVNRTRYFYTQ